MATISKRGSGWFVQIRRKGFAPRYRTFSSKSEATAWARHEESQIDRGLWSETGSIDRRLTVRDMLERYKSEVTSKKRGAEPELCRISKMQREPMCDLALLQLSPSAVADYREKRLLEVKPPTVRRELAILRHAIDKARNEWRINLPRNPVKQIELPSAGCARERRLEEGEFELIAATVSKMRNPEVMPIILLAIETAMRRSELLNLEWRDVNLKSAIALIRQSKNGYSRTIPLTSRAIETLDCLERRTGRIFEMSPNALRQTWGRICKKVGIENLRFHDLRHEAISRFCELGLSVPEVALISGHRDPRMLFRYTHLRPIDLARKLNSMPNIRQ